MKLESPNTPTKIYPTKITKKELAPKPKTVTKYKKATTTKKNIKLNTKKINANTMNLNKNSFTLNTNQIGHYNQTNNKLIKNGVRKQSRQM